MTVWRELRHSPVETGDEIIQKTAQTEDSGDWAEFVRIMGGVLIPRMTTTDLANPIMVKQYRAI